MDIPSVSPDDLLDVMEMMQKIENFILRTIKDNQSSLGISAIMSASINSILAQCKTLEEVMLYRNIFFNIYDSAIKNIKIN